MATSHSIQIGRNPTNEDISWVEIIFIGLVVIILSGIMLGILPPLTFFIIYFFIIQNLPADSQYKFPFFYRITLEIAEFRLNSTFALTVFLTICILFVQFLIIRVLSLIFN